MEVKIICGAQYAYAAITEENRALDVPLRGGRSANTSLIESAAELRAEAEIMLNRASLIERASAYLS